MSINQFNKELQKGLKQPAYLLYSDDEFLLKEALFQVKKTIPQGMLDFLYSRFDASESSGRTVEQALEALMSVPFFGGGGARQVVAIENAHKLTDKEASEVGRYLKSPSKDSVLILLYTVVKGKEKIKPQHKEKLAPVCAIALQISEAELPRWVCEKARVMGLEISADAVEYLIGTIGPEPGLLSSEIEKLGLLGKNRIERADIREIIRGSGGFDVFDLAEALRAKNRNRVFRIFASLRDDVAPENILGVLNWQFQRNPLPDKQSMARVYEILSDADLRLKSSGSYYALEEMLFRLLEI